jgi:hypothetical protein
VPARRVERLAHRAVGRLDVHARGKAPAGRRGGGQQAVEEVARGGEGGERALFAMPGKTKGRECCGAGKAVS